VALARVSNTIVVVAVPAALEVKTPAHLVSMARAQPSKLNWAGTTGTNESVPPQRRVAAAGCGLPDQTR
jgi:tripartite-type tricarboxylate transporter receptor subunit TctC